jgi:ligand-binding SRPBCC domain-containing protein
VRTSTLERTLRVASTIEDAFSFFSSPHNLAAITPPWLHFAILDAPETAYAGAHISYRLRLKGVPIRWLTEITEWRPPRTFTDVQRVGPYRVWEHTHRLTALDDGTEIHDHVRYVVPGGPAAPFVDRYLVRPMLEEIFDYRTERLSSCSAARRESELERPVSPCARAGPSRRPCCR